MRSIFFNVFQSLIVVLYVLDNETNTVVRISVFIGLLIEIWKIKKVVNVTVNINSVFFPVEDCFTLLTIIGFNIYLSMFSIKNSKYIVNEICELKIL